MFALFLLLPTLVIFCLFPLTLVLFQLACSWFMNAAMNSAVI